MINKLDKDSRNAWLYTIWTTGTLLSGFYFLLYMNQYHLYTNMIAFITAMSVQLYWCSKYMYEEIVINYVVVREAVYNWIVFLQYPNSFNKVWFYHFLGCDIKLL